MSEAPPWFWAVLIVGYIAGYTPLSYLWRWLMTAWRWLLAALMAALLHVLRRVLRRALRG